VKTSKVSTPFTPCARSWSCCATLYRNQGQLLSQLRTVPSAERSGIAPLREFSLTLRRTRKDRQTKKKPAQAGFFYSCD